MTLQKWLVATFLSFFLSGCLLGPDFRPPDIELPPKYSSSLEESSQFANLKWWEVYQSPELQTLIRVALENNQELGVALARIEEAQALLGIARADYFPELGLQGALSRIEYENEERSLEERERWSLSAPLSWELDIFGKFRRANEAARAEMMSREYFYRATTLSLVANVAATYFQLLDLENRLRISEKTASSRKESTRLIFERFKQGYIAEIDLFQARIQEELAVASSHALKRAVRQTENAIHVLLGGFTGEIPRGASLLEQKPLPTIPAGLPSELLQRRPDILAAKKELHAQTARIGVAEALRFPSLSLTGTFGAESVDLQEFSFAEDRLWSFSADVLSPLLSANRNINRVEAEEARTKQLAYRYYQTVINAFREVEDALIAVTTFRDEHAARNRQVKAGRAASRLSWARYNGGETNYLEVLDNERSLFQAELAESEALRRKFVATIDLYRALGGGWQLEAAVAQDKNTGTALPLLRPKEK